MSDILIHAVDLLRHAGTLDDYERLLAESSGARFNIFDILHVKHYEVATHSPILAELLNPRGRHGLGHKPLELFIDQLKLGDFDPKSALVTLEYDAGIRTEDEGGRIDLLLRDRYHRQILIENKIYAVDQDNQTFRYLKSSAKGLLLYLTLDGREPSNAGPADKSRLRCISYRDQILPWLITCRKEASAWPIVRETLTQYIQLIQELTQQNENSRMNSKLVEAVLESEQKLRAFVTLRNATTAVEDAIAVWLGDKLHATAKDLHLDFKMTAPLRQAYGGFRFFHPELTEQNVFIGFEFERPGYREFCVGFGCIKESEKSPLHDELKQALKSVGLGKVYQSVFWPGWIVWDRYESWNTGETLAAVRFGPFISDTKEMTQRLLQIGLETINKHVGNTGKRRAQKVEEKGRE